VAGPTVKDDNEVWTDLRRNPEGWGQFSPFLRHSSLEDTPYSSLLVPRTEKNWRPAPAAGKLITGSNAVGNLRKACSRLFPGVFRSGEYRFRKGRCCRCDKHAGALVSGPHSPSKTGELSPWHSPLWQQSQALMQSAVTPSSDLQVLPWTRYEWNFLLPLRGCPDHLTYQAVIHST